MCVNKQTTIEKLLESVCSKRQLNPADHYVRLKLPNTPPGSYSIPEMQESIKKLVSLYLVNPFTPTDRDRSINPKQWMEESIEVT